MLGAWLANGEMARAQFVFEADALFLRQDNRGSSSFITGPDSISTGDVDFGFKSGYRFALSGGGSWWEVEAVFAQIDDWSDSSTSILANPLVLDDTFDNGVVVPVPPANRLGFQSALSAAASNPNAGGVDETLESEQLQGGALADLIAGWRASSRYRDFELNFATNRNASWYRFGVGYRNFQLNENATFLTQGIFNALDTDDAAVFGDPTNDPNDALSDAALTAAGFTSVSGGSDGFDAVDVPISGPDILTAYYFGSANNELNGVQAIFAAHLSSNEWFILEGIAKAGLYHNSVDARTTELLIGSLNDDSVYRRTFTDQKGTASFVGSLGFRAVVPVTDYISLVGGYEGILATGIALGTEQNQGIHTDLFGNQAFTAKANDSTILHGGKLGVEVAF